MEEPTQNQEMHVKADYDQNTKLAVASTSVVDRQGEIIDQSGWDLKNYKKDPVLMWAHDHTIPKIGVAKNIKVNGEGKKAQLVFEPEFNEITQLSKDLKQIFEKDGGSFSVGFQPIESEGNMYTKQELLEISAVNVPANPEARMMAYKSMKKAGFSDGAIKELGIEVEKSEDTKEPSEIEVLQKEFADFRQDMEEKMQDVVKGLKHLNPVGRDRQVTAKRLESAKVVAKAADKMLSRNKSQVQAKIAKRAAEKLIASYKQEIKQHGQN